MVNRLWITEKPSVAQALVAGLCAAFDAKATRRPGHFELSTGDVVAPLQGHLLEAEFIPEALQKLQPSAYWDHLPFRYADLVYSPKPEIDRKSGKVSMRGGKPIPSPQLGIVTDLMKRAREIVNAGDVDREGQLIVDELLLYCGISPEGKTKPIWRLPLVSVREEDLAAQVKQLTESNGDPKWVRRRHSALARQHCDMLVGANGSMAFQAASGYRRMSVGRVQTPVVCCIVDREREIRNFKPRNYFVPVVTLADGTVMRFSKRQGAEGQPGFDEQGRIVDENVARQMVGRIAAGLKGTISLADKRNNSEAPPLPFSATVLYSTVSKRTGITPKEAESAAQSVYEKHKAISYVGTDCQFLPTSMLEDARAIMATLSRGLPAQASGADLAIRSRAWDDAKVDEHFAIVPTKEGLGAGANEAERAVYDAVARRFIAQFYPNHESITHRLAAMFGQDEFKATSREVTRMGWREVEGNLEQGGPGSDRAAEADADADADADLAGSAGEDGRDRKSVRGDAR
jgi:DNA topoisomerase-3